MTFFALMFVFGAWVLQHMPSLPSLYWLAALFPFAAVVFKSRPNSALRHVALMLLAFLAGFMWAAIFAQYRLSDALPKKWETRPVQLIGIVASMPQLQERGERFEFDIEQVISKGATVPRHISLTQYSSGFATHESLGNQKEQSGASFHAGERWQLTVRLKRPHGTANPHGFDFESWALERNIRAAGSISKDTRNKKISNFVFHPAYMVEWLREKVRDRMMMVLIDKPYGGILQALAIGDENAIQQSDWQVFLRTGTNHLMSISGLHITMLAGLAFGLVYALWRQSARLTLRLPARKAATLAGVVTALAYALLAGFSVPTQRTLYMLAVFALALWNGRGVSITRVLALALLTVTLLDPWAVLAPGFWLSFGAVAVITYAVSGRAGRLHWMREAINTQWAVSLGLVPLLLVLFQQVSIISPVANALAIPLVSLIVVPLTLLGSLLPIDGALNFAHSLMAVCMWALQWLSNLPLSNWQQHAPPAWTLPLAMFGVMWILLPRGFPMRWLGAVALLPMFLIAPPGPELGAMKIAVMDVGQGLAVVVRTAKHTLLYDAGPRYSSQSDSGSRIVVPYLRGEGIRRLDGMVISHNDTDHSGGMASILLQMPVSWLASSLPENMPELADVHHLHCYAGQSWEWDGVHFDMLGPSLASYGTESVKDNNRSCVLRIASQYGSLLLTGDIEKEAEAVLMETATERLVSDVLVVPHHGSKTSSSYEFIQLVNPKLAIFTVGYLNRFNHPKPAVVERYEQMESQLYRSDQDGALLLDFSSKKGITIIRWRSYERRYWQDANLFADDVVGKKTALLAEKALTR